MTLKEAIVRRRHVQAEEIWALRDVSLDVEPGESIGFVGRNGSGKTTLLRLIAGIFAPTTGRHRGRGLGRLAARARRRLPPRLHGPRERLPERLDLRPQAALRATSVLDEIVSFAELERFIDFPVRTYSSGMLHAAWLRDRGARRGGRAAAGRGVRGRRRGVPAQVRRPDPRVQGQAARCASSRTPRPRSSTLCERAVLLARATSSTTATSGGDDAATTRSSPPRRCPRRSVSSLRESGTRRGSRRSRVRRQGRRRRAAGSLRLG